MMDGKSDKWRNAADDLLATLAVENKYIVSDMLIIFLESAGYGLEDWSPLGWVFKRAAKKGIIKRIERPGKQALWHSLVYGGAPSEYRSEHNVINQPIFLEGFGSIDGPYTVTEAKGGKLSLQRVRVN